MNSLSTMAGEFRFLEDVALADAAFEASGETLAELFEAAARAVIETMVNPATVAVPWSRAVDLREDSPEALLFEWLSRIVYFKDAAGVVYHDARADIRKEDGAIPWRLTGRLRGEPVDVARHELRADVKAVTKHLYSLRREDNRWVARVVLDI
jgi:SHS2 domain-containing protein